MKKRDMSERIGEVKLNLVAQSRMEGVTPTVRVTTDIAKAMLLHNTSVIIGGIVRYLNLRPIGLGVYEVTFDTDVPKQDSNKVFRK